MAVGSYVESWATATSTHKQNGRKIIFRYAQKFLPNFDRASRSIRIIIVWRYDSNTGLPITEDHQRMNELEDALESVLDKDHFATLAIVSTGENLREWTYYAESQDEFMTRLNRVLGSLPQFPIEIHIAEDPNWGTYEQFASSVKAPG